MYTIQYNKNVLKEIQKLKENKLAEKAHKLIEIIKINPYQMPPPYEKLVDDLESYYSRRINLQHRLVYQVIEDEKKVRILSAWSHYENM